MRVAGRHKNELDRTNFKRITGLNNPLQSWGSIHTQLALTGPVNGSCPPPDQKAVKRFNAFCDQSQVAVWRTSNSDDLAAKANDLPVVA